MLTAENQEIRFVPSLLMVLDVVICKNSKLPNFQELYSKNQQSVGWFIKWIEKSWTPGKLPDWKEHSPQMKSKKRCFPWLQKSSRVRLFYDGFLQHCQDIVNHDLLALLTKFHSNRKISRGNNTTFIILIEKIPELIPSKTSDL